MDKYRLYCETDSKYEYVIASTEPTQCPINSGHAVRSGSVSLSEPDILVNDGTPKELTLADYKKLRLNEIDNRTQELILQGFSFGSPVETFSLSEPAQTNWIGLKQAADAGMITFPTSVSTKDDGEYSIADAAELANFYGAGLAAKKSHLDSGRSLKISINSAADEAAVDAVVDSR